MPASVSPALSGGEAENSGKESKKQHSRVKKSVKKRKRLEKFNFRGYFIISYLRTLSRLKSDVLFDVGKTIIF